MNYFIGLVLIIASTVMSAGDYYILYSGGNYSTAGPYEAGEYPASAVCKVPMNGDEPYRYESIAKQGDGVTPDCDMDTPAVYNADEHAELTTELALIPQRAAAYQILKEGLVAKTWDQMSVAERKVATDQMPTDAELGLE